ncbi:response regulator [Methylomarinum vadi]|uniref:response regulator n=1 Tax=Methylomarinum vadi TaxID=438855 RepID=UPI0004DF46FD|nr:response regulator [Methylomarinum vadi]
MHFKINTKGIRFRLFFMGVAPALLLVISLASYFVEHQFHYLEQSLHERGQTIAKQLAVASIYGVFSGNKAMLKEMANDLLQEKDVVFVAIKNLNGEILAYSSNMLNKNSEKLKIFDAAVRIQSLRQNAAAMDFNLFEIEDSDKERKIGSVSVGISPAPIQAARHQYLRNSLTIIIGCFIFALMLAFRLSKTISSPLINLTQVANDLANGNMDARAGTTTTTEIATLCESFNAMAVGLQETQDYLLQQVNNAVKELTVTMEKLEEKNQSLEKTTQLAIAQNETKSQFLAHISHEIRTPMNGIIGFIELLTQSELTPRQLEQAKLIKTSACTLLTIVNEILDYSSLETGSFRTESVAFDIRECIENSITAIVSRRRDVQIIIDIAPDLPTMITSDPVRLSQVLTNLVGNASKYTDRGYIIIRGTLTKQSKLFISVTDTGIGIAKDVMKDLFHPFLQISEYAVNKELGTGLGLTIAKNIVERLGGNIGVKSQLGKGSTFWFDLPITTVNEQPTEEHDALISIIDPLSIRRKALLKQLTHLGFGCRLFASVEQYQQAGAWEIILYAAGESLKTDDDFNTELARIRTFTGNKKIIFMTHPLQNPGTVDILPIPCRSAFLDQLITDTLSLFPKPPSDKLALPEPDIPPSFPVFIADDNEINRLLLKSQLESRSSDITLAEDGKQALSLLQQRKYQLILLDLQMPYYSGLELLEKIKEKDCINHNTPVIAITAHAQSHQRKKLIDAGFDECLIKPVLLEQLEEMLDLWQSQSRNAPSQPSPGMEFLEQMLEKTSHNEQLAEVLFNKLFIELPEQLANIQQAIDQSDFALAKEITHKLHGSVSFCGFISLKDAARQLEIDLSNQKVEASLMNFAALKQGIDHFLNQKQTILRELSKADAASEK